MKKTILFILKVAILIFLFCWIVIVFVDYFRVRQSKEPMFCISEKTVDYDDGSNTICTGLGYKVIHYNRTCLNATEFGPFLIHERQCE